MTARYPLAAQHPIPPDGALVGWASGSGCGLRRVAEDLSQVRTGPQLASLTAPGVLGRRPF